MTREILQKRVEKQVQERFTEIAVGVYNKLVHSHNDSSNCDCNYCKVLKEYVIKKIQMTRAKRHMIGRHWDRFGDCMEDERFYESLEHQAQQFKREKDVIKNNSYLYVPRNKRT